MSSWICGYLGVLTGTSYSSVDPLCVWYFRGVFAASFIHLSYCPTGLESLPSAIRRLSPWALRLAGLLVEFSLCSSFGYIPPPPSLTHLDQWILLIQRIRLRMKRLRITKPWIEILGSSYLIIILETEEGKEAAPEWPKKMTFQNHELKRIDVGTKMPY